ncbi:hypothetical protein H072_4390 [Dactylellina haptotyla CBS 200.50]|uniref:DUF7492 domain-containing protein n=1 Tax=Dactylellina haptotyla (strain CBS 200.50) TaxID=1284197 RepID=S8AKM8_DACHA|nr:hypothetical protein H072_4390 [Dactylellina haptotyla CBS 200.50]
MDFALRIPRLFGIQYIILLLAILSGNVVDGHSWVDELSCASGPFFTSNPAKGYIRNYVGRQSTQIDSLTTFRILDLSSKQMVCAPRVQSPGQEAGFPKLKATPGDLIRASYLENGHIWQTLAGQNGPQAKSGTIYWYGTQNPKADRDIASVLKWTRDGKGGDGQGKLLDITPFDDGVCIETGHENAGPGRVSGPCKSYFRLPKDAQVGKDYTVYWLWDYSEHFGPAKPGFIEWYSSCMDIEIVSTGKRTTTGSASPAKTTPKTTKTTNKPKSTPKTTPGVVANKKVKIVTNTIKKTSTIKETVTQTTTQIVSGATAAAGKKQHRREAEEVEVDIEEREAKILPADSAPMVGLNRHLRREQLREERRQPQPTNEKRAWYSFWL